MDFLSRAQAVQTLIDHTPRLAVMEKVSLAAAVGRTLARPVVAHQPLPPFSRAAMDGYAVRTQDLPGSLKVVGAVAAGEVWAGTLQPGQVIRILTGAPVPAGADAVVEQEVVEVRGGDAHIGNRYRSGRNISAAGSEYAAGVPVLEIGQRLLPAHIGLIAGLGMDQVWVWKKPRVLLVITGDELVGAGERLAPGAIYDANGPLFSSLGQEAGAEVFVSRRSSDRWQDVAHIFAGSLTGFEVIITTGGVSVGDRDNVIRYLRDAPGAELLFWRVNMHPGKSMAAARIQERTVIALSGNPGAALTGWYLIVLPFLAYLHHGESIWSAVTGRLCTPYPKTTRETRFLKAQFRWGSEGVRFDWQLPQASDMLRSFPHADGFVVIPQGSAAVSDTTWVQGLAVPGMGQRLPYWVPSKE